MLYHYPYCSFTRFMHVLFMY